MTYPLIGTALITHNRIEYTKRTLESFLENTEVDHFIVAFDNASTDGTQEYIKYMYDQGLVDYYILNSDNSYPGFACNHSWNYIVSQYPQIPYLHRCDNDLLYQKGWDIETIECFDSFPDLGQFGIMNQEEEFPDGQNIISALISESGKSINVWWGNIGGPCVIRRELWDLGLRYRNDRWSHNGAPAAQEDVFLSEHVRSLGYSHANMIPHLVHHMGDIESMMSEEYKDYYTKTLTERGYDYDDFVTRRSAALGKITRI